VFFFDIRILITSLWYLQILLTFSDNNLECISQKLGKELESYSEWRIDNKLSLHLDKTEYILVGPKRKLKTITDFQN
jgi:hypothetical protein